MRLGERIERAQRLKSRTADAGALLVVALVTGFVAFAISLNFGSLTVSNSTDHLVSRCNVTVCGRTFELSDIQPGNAKQVVYFISGDSSYKIRYLAPSSVEFEADCGYITAFGGSLLVSDRLTICNGDVAFGDRFGSDSAPVVARQ